MITINTGLPRNGKTLFTITEVEKQRISENREVYYHGIPDLMLPWLPLDDPKKWFELPNKSIIVIDEAQQTFRPRGNGSAVPDYIEQFETHGHQGFDIYLITQHPMLIDGNIRRLTNSHNHVVRKFGNETATIHHWESCKETCDKSRADSIKTTFNYPKQNYDLYKSASDHTVKAHVPLRMYMLYFGLPALVIALSVFAYFSFHKTMHSAEEKSLESKSALQSNFSGRNLTTGTSKKDDDPNYYYVQNTPRIKDLALSMPKYDEVTKPKVAPVPAACIQSHSKCQCYTQQGTHMVVSEDFCKSIVANGYFIDFDNSGLDKQQPPTSGGENIPPMQRTQVASAAGLSPSSGAVVNYVVPDDLQPRNPRPHYANLQPPRL